MKTRVIFITHSYGSGGTERHLIDFVRRLDPARTEAVILCCGLDSYSAVFENIPYVQVRKVAVAKRRTFVSYWIELSKLRPAVIVFVNGVMGQFPWYAYLAARLSRAKRVFAIEHLIADPLPGKVTGQGALDRLRRILGWRNRTIKIARLAALLCDKTICVSNAVREVLVMEYEYPDAKTVAILNGVDLNHFSPSNASERQSRRAALGFGADEAIILCISNLVPPKRHDVLLDAFRIVAKNHPSSKCVLLGYGPLEAKLRAYTSELGLSDRVVFAGYIKDVRPYLEAADLFVMSSDREGLPLALGEAMAYGLPCVVTDAGGNREIVVHGKTGFVVKRGSPRELGEAIDYLLAQAEARAQFGANGKQRVHEQFNMDNSMGALQELLLSQR